MRIGLVIGTLTLSQWHPSLSGAAYRLVTPLTWDDLASGRSKEDSPQLQGEPIVVYDELGAGLGSRIAISEGGEAAQPFYPKDMPIDAYNAAILDAIDIYDERQTK